MPRHAVTKTAVSRYSPTTTERTTCTDEVLSESEGGVDGTGYRRALGHLTSSRSFRSRHKDTRSTGSHRQPWFSPPFANELDFAWPAVGARLNAALLRILLGELGELSSKTGEPGYLVLDFGYPPPHHLSRVPART